MTTITVEDMTRDFSAYLRRVESGETLLLTDADRPVAEIRPVVAATRDRRPHGLCAGEFVVPADFDDPHGILSF